VDFETMYRAMDSRDSRFDGRFFVAVKTTRVYCRPICPAPTPKRKNTVFYHYAAAAELAGFRPCRRCRPEVSPDTAEWDTRADLLGRGLRLIAEGFADQVGVSGLAERLGVSERHLQRIFKEEVGVTPGVMARSRRARLARQLLTETTMPITSVAFAAGFASVRAFNETIQRIYRMTPTAMRRGGRVDSTSIDLKLRFRRPFAADVLLHHLAIRAIPGVEEVVDGSYRRTIPFGADDAIIELTPTSSAVVMKVETAEIDHLAPVIQHARRLMDLDADPEVIDSQLSRSSVLKPHVREVPGIRLPGAFDPFETAVLGVLGRGSLTAATTTAGRLTRTFGKPLTQPAGSLTHLFPTPARLASVDLTEAGIPPSRAATLGTLASEIGSGRLALDGAMDLSETTRRLRQIEGIGAKTLAGMVSSVLRDPDIFIEPGVGQLRRLFGDEVSRLHDSSDEWRPWRGYAAMHLWAAVSVPGLSSGVAVPTGFEPAFPA
jgi:AraC family transcriptional regulator of adaptative response / DNA-3-methyladenine glycosylase II